MSYRWTLAALAASALLLSGTHARPAKHTHHARHWSMPLTEEPYPTSTAESDTTVTIYSTSTILSTAGSAESDTTVVIYSTSTILSTTTTLDVVTVFPTLSIESQTSLYGIGATGIVPTGAGIVPSGAFGYTMPTASGYATPTASGTAHSNSTSSNSSTSMPDMLRGVNIGGWLILEEWMNSDMFEGTNATDQYSFDQTAGAQEKLETHWSTYFTEADVAKIASWGINALRIPIGYWAYDTFGNPYIQGADAYLEKAIGWARTYGLKVLVDCHGSPGSQNGFDNSGRSGNVEWQDDNNLNDSITILEIISEKYGAESYADVVFAIELVNEPISWDQNNFAKTQQWAQDANSAVKAKATNPDLMVIMHDGFMGPSNWETVGDAINGNASSKTHAKFAIDVHLYQNQDADYEWMNQDEHIAAACNWTNSELLPASATLPVFVGEWSSGTNICAYPNGTTSAGTSCDVTGCQCSVNVPLQYWDAPLTKATRQFVDAQLDAFEHSSNGWFIWAYHGPGGWGLDNMIEYGLIGNPVTEREYKNQCGFASD